MTIFKNRREVPKPECPVDTADRHRSGGFFALEGRSGEKDLYYALRERVPVIDACIAKIVRLTGGFRAIALEENFQEELDRFVKTVPVGPSGLGLQTFSDCYLDSLLTCGHALGEIIYGEESRGVEGLYVAPMKKIDPRPDSLGGREYYHIGSKEPIPINNPENLLFTALGPTAEQPCGVSVLKGLPSLSAILLRIYDCIGHNFDRAGNVRYAVTYKPSSDSGDKAFAKERAKQLAEQWSKGMAASKNGSVQDFVAVGDVSIKAIGADCQILDTEVPVRQILEQLISKLSIPPFLLGLNWSTTERMSSQQADILTSELEYYRRLMTPALEKIVSAHLRLLGSSSGGVIEWENINLQDETELALARLRNAQAKSIEISNIKEEKSIGE